MATCPRPRLVVLASRIRFEERAILNVLERRGIAYDRLEERTLSFVLGDPLPGRSAVLNRCISFTRALYAARLLEAAGIKVINESRVIEICGDKLLTSLALVRASLPVPRTMAALTPEAARQAIETLGLPAVIKPLVGSWGRLLARVNDYDAVEALLAHKKLLGSPHDGVIYVQEHIDKPGRDIRTIVIGEEVVAAMYRTSDHWITNAARGGRPLPCSLDPELEELSLRAAAAVGGGALAVDILERSNGARLINEVNHMMEFHSVSEVCDRDIAGCLVDYALELAGQ
jgi:[lysine-biosynthesis-protein LysW]---L-2-aminoadipate ligase